MSQRAFRIERIRKYFGPTRALDIKNGFDVWRGGITAILGLSGSGKSTLLNVLGLLEEPDPGTRITYYPPQTGQLDSPKPQQIDLPKGTQAHLTAQMQDAPSTTGLIHLSPVSPAVHEGDATAIQISGRSDALELSPSEPPISDPPDFQQTDPLVPTPIASTVRGERGQLEMDSTALPGSTQTEIAVTGRDDLAASDRLVSLKISSSIPLPSEQTAVEKIGSLEYGQLSRRKRRELLSKHFGVAFQDGHLVEHLTATDNITSHMAFAGASRSEAARICHSLVDQLKMDARAAGRPKELSGGEYQRVAMARAIAHNPNIIFADEPTGNLDTDTGQMVMEMLRSWQSQSPNNALLLVTHDVQQAFDYGDYFIILENGEVRFTLTRDELLDSAAKWRGQSDVPEGLAGPNILIHLLKREATRDGSSTCFPRWSGTTSWFNRVTYLIWYSFRDLFPIKIFPFNWNVFKSTLRDTVFSILTILSVVMLVSVLLLGLGIFFGVKRHQERMNEQDLRANRLIVEIKAESTVKEITPDLLSELSAALDKISVKPPFSELLLPWKRSRSQLKPAVRGVYGFSGAELFIFPRPDATDTFGIIGTTVDPVEPLQDRLRSQGQRLAARPITDYDTEGIVLTSDLAKRLLLQPNPDGSDVVFINYGRGDAQSSKEALRVLAVVDDLPDGQFLISPGNWHKIRDRFWRSNYRFCRIQGLNRVGLLTLATNLSQTLTNRFPSVRLQLQQEATQAPYLMIDCGFATGWRKQYWQQTIYSQFIRPLLPTNSPSRTQVEPFGEVQAEGAKEALTYINAVVYLTDLAAVEDVGRVIRRHPSRLGVDRYVESAYKRIHQTAQFSGLILGVIALCSLFFCGVTIFLTFYQTVLRKRHEIGILKAFGSSAVRITQIFLVESFQMGVLGCMLGLLLAQVAGQQISKALADIYELKLENAGALFYLNAYVVVLVILVVIFLCEFITFLATFSTSRQTANGLLHEK